MKTMNTGKTNRIFLLPILAVFFAIVLACFAFSPVFAAAEGAPVRIALQEKTVHRGQTFSMDVAVAENPGLISMKLYVDYDHTAMKLIDVKRENGLSAMTMTTTNVETDAGYSTRPFTLFFDAVSTTTDTGVLVKLLFESNIEAPIGDYAVSVTYDAINTNRAYQTPVALDIQGGEVHLIAGEFSAKYVDWDGTELYEKDYNDGDVPSYVGQTPSRAADDCYTYSFTGWKGDVSEEPNVLLYRANYSAVPKVYTVFYYVDGFTETPDEIFDETDFYFAEEKEYGSEVNLDYVPQRKKYTFVGWFADEKFSQPIVGLTMPSKDIRVYGYMRYNVRISDIPKIRLTYSALSESEVLVDVNLTYNPGVNGMVLTLDYDRESLRFARFTRGTALSDMQFATTNLEGGLDQETFRFYWESATNSSEQGLILSMVFDVTNCETGIYPVTFTYDESRDATYRNGVGEIWYTRLDIKGISIPVGERYHWNEPVGDVTIDVTSTDGKPLDVELVVRKSDASIAEESIQKLKEQNLVIKNKYEIRLVRGGEVVTSENDLRIAIGLTEEELKSENLSLYYVDSNGKLVKYDFSVEDEEAVFNMRNIEHWVLAGDAPAPVAENAWTPEAIRTVLIPSLLSVTVLAYAILLLSKNGKYKQKINNLEGKGGKG